VVIPKIQRSSAGPGTSRAPPNGLSHETGLEYSREIALPKFEECLQRLEKIVQELETGDVPLEKSLTLFEEGMKLSGTCRKELEDAEGKVEILLKQNGKLHAEAFEPPSDSSPAKKS
jgi:exodeoxyribonuclease VII small subunit